MSVESKPLFHSEITRQQAPAFNQLAPAPARQSKLRHRAGLIGAVLVASATLLPASPFSADPKATKAYFHKICDYIATEKTNCQVIFTGGYYMRDLVAGYQIYGEKRYLDIAVAYADRLLAKQSSAAIGKPATAGCISPIPPAPSGFSSCSIIRWTTNGSANTSPPSSVTWTPSSATG